MMEIIAMLIVAFLAVAGVMALVEWSKRCLYADKDACVYLLVPADENSEDIEIAIKRAKFYRRCFGSGAQKKIIVLDNGMNEFSKEIVQKECEDSENILLMRSNELQKLR